MIDPILESRRGHEIWRFLEIEAPPNHPFEIGIFHEMNHPAIGVAPFMETPIFDDKTGYESSVD